MKQLAQADAGRVQRQGASVAGGHQGPAGDERRRADIDSVMLEIRAGTGGEEAALFAGDLLDMYTPLRRAPRLEGRAALDASPTDLGGFREVVLNVKGDGVCEPPGLRGRRPPRAARAQDRGPGPHPHLRRHRGRAAGAGGDRGQHQLGQGRAGARQPRRRPGRAERQQGRVGHPAGAHAHRHHRLDARREEPAQEPRQGPPHPGRARVRASSAAAGGGRGGRRARA